MIYADSLRLTPEDAAEQMYARMRRDMREAGLAAERRLRALERFAEEVEAIAADLESNWAEVPRDWRPIGELDRSLDRLREATS